MKTSPTQRSMKYLREKDFIVCKVEQKIHMPTAPYPITRDAFGFGDLLIAKRGFGAALVQVTDASSVSARVRKIKGFAKDPTDEKQVNEAAKAHANALVWLESGNRIFVQGWAKRGARGQKKKWTVIEQELTLEGIRQ